MAESWSLSLVERDGVSGLLLVDDDLLEVAPVEGLGWLILARLRIGADTPASEVEAVEGALNRRVEAAGGRFVGHLRSSVELLSLSYVAEAPDGEVRRRLEEGWTSVEVRSDPAWSMVLSTLSPTDRERQAGLDMLVMAELRHEGDDHARRRPVDHELSFPDGEAAHAFVEDVRAEGFIVSNSRTQAREVLVDIARADTISGPGGGISEVVWYVRQTAERHGGRYDGWGAPVVKAPARRLGGLAPGSRIGPRRWWSRRFR